MASSRAIRAARAFVEIFGDDSKLRKTLKGAQARLAAFGRGVAAVGKAAFAGLAVGAAAGTAAAIGAVSKFVAVGDQLDKMSARTGASTEFLSQMGFAMEQSGSSLEDFGRGLKGMANFLQGAERGLSTSTDTLRDLGLTMADLKDLSPEKRFELFADRISQIEDPTRRAATAMDVFGRAGESMLPLLNGGPEAIAELRKEADSLGRTVSGEQATNAAALGDAWNRFKSVVLGVSLAIGGYLAPHLTRLVDWVTQSISKIREWITTNEDVGESLLAIKDALDSGEYKLAAEVLWLSLKEAFLAGIQPLREAWIGFKNSFLQVFDSMLTAGLRKWAEFQGYLASAIVELMAYFDDTINAEDVQRTLTEDVERRIRTISDDAAARTDARDANVSAEMTALDQQLSAARAALAAARQEARSAADAAEDTTESANDKFKDMIGDIDSAQINVKNANVAAAPQAGDLRSVSGSGQLVALVNRQGALEERQVSLLSQVRTLQKELLTVTKNGPRVVQI